MHLNLILIKESWDEMYHGFQNNCKVIRNYSWAVNQHIRMTSEGSCDTEDWSNYCWRFSFDITGMNYSKKKIYIYTVYMYVCIHTHTHTHTHIYIYILYTVYINIFLIVLTLHNEYFYCIFDPILCSTWVNLIEHIHSKVIKNLIDPKPSNGSV